MLVQDIFRLATRMFRTNRSRTILTILGISVGISTIIVLVSLGYGLQRVILSQITTSDALLSLDVTVGAREELVLKDDHIKIIQNITGVDEISPLITTPAQMNIDDISSEVNINFVNREFFQLEGTVLKKGDFYEDKDLTKVIISSATLQLFNLSEDDIFSKNINFSLYTESDEDDRFYRDTIKLDDSFRVVGIIEDELSSYVYMPFSISDKLKNKVYDKFKVKVKTDKDIEMVKNSLIEKDFAVSALSDVIEQANQIFKVAKIVLALFGIIALIVSAIGMFNTMTIALLERTQEIGVMKALGATNLDIWNMFLAEAVIIGFLGGTGGILLGLFGGEVINYGINFLAGALGGERIDLFFTPGWFIALVIGFSTAVGLITGFYPAKRAADINVLEALRYK